MAYPEAWEADVVLADGGTVHVRPIRPDDAPLVEALHSRLSDETVYLRFFTALPRLSRALLERFTHVDYHDRFALVAELGDDLIAVARYDRLPGRPEADVAFVVEDAHQGRGLGTLLLEHLAAAAREEGIHRFTAQTLATNARMLHVFRDAGFAVERRFEGGIVDVVLDIDPTAASATLMHDRERTAAARSVARLLAPRSIAVVGTGRERGNLGHEVFRNLMAGGFAGPVYPVHPTADHVAGVQALPSVLHIADEVDVAVIAVPADDVPDVVGQCARKGVRGLVVISDGFAETGPQGAAAERRLVEQARRSGMRLIGPNCMGVLNTAPGVRMNATVAAVDVAPGRIGVMSQAGGLGIAVLEEARERGLGISTFVAAGNKADVSGNDLLQFWEDDPETDVCLLYLESFGNPRTFSRIARRISRNKPIVAVKAARRALGDEVPDAVIDALFDQTGVLRVDSFHQLADVGQALASQPLPAGRRVAVLANAGGPGVLAADACAGFGLDVVALEQLGAFSPAADYEAALRSLGNDQSVDAVIVGFFPAHPVAVEDYAAAVGRASAGFDKPVLANFPGRRSVLPGERRVPSYPFPEAAAFVLARMVSRTEWLARPVGTVPELDVDAEAAHDLVHGREGRLSDDEVARLLACYGVASAACGEIVVGVVQHRAFGPLIRFGDAYRVLPLTDIDARELVGGVAVVEDVLVRLGRLAEDVPEVVSVELTPTGAAVTVAPPPDPAHHRPDLRRRLR